MNWWRSMGVRVDPLCRTMRRYFFFLNRYMNSRKKQPNFRLRSHRIWKNNARKRRWPSTLKLYFMTLYACYTLFFLVLLLRRKGITRTISINERETNAILLGMVVYCASFFVSFTLIEFRLKNEAFRIMSHHVLIVAIIVFFLIKMIKTNDP